MSISRRDIFKVFAGAIGVGVAAKAAAATPASLPSTHTISIHEMPRHHSPMSVTDPGHTHLMYVQEWNGGLVLK